MRRNLLFVTGLLSCARTDANPAAVHPAEPREQASVAGRDASLEPEVAATGAEAGFTEAVDEPPPPGCWQAHYGEGPRPGETKPSLAEPIPGCADCEALRAGPLVQGLHVEVIRRLRALERSLPTPRVDEPVLWVNSGARDGPAGGSMHNQALAVDVVICGLDTIQTAQHLRDVGFACVIEYFDAEGNPCNMAHGDLRGTEHAQGAYGLGGRKAKTCPARAVAKGGSCQLSNKADWTYAPTTVGTNDEP